MDFRAYCPACIYKFVELSNTFYIKSVGHIKQYLVVVLYFLVGKKKPIHAPVCCLQQREQSSSEPSGMEQGERSIKTSVVSYVCKPECLSMFPLLHSVI